jgi:hypothetical protein
MDPEQRRRQRNQLVTPADLDPARAPRVSACEIVGHDRGSAAAGARRETSSIARAREHLRPDLDPLVSQLRFESEDWPRCRRARRGLRSV